MDGGEARRRRRRLVGLAGPIVVALITTSLAALGLEGGVFASFRRQASDALLPSTALGDDIVVVGIDSRSLANVGKPWPWPRDLHGEIIRHLGDAGAKLVVYDILFAPDTPLDGAIAAAMQTTPVVVAAVGTEPERTERGPFRFGSLTPPVPVIAAEAAGLAHANVTADPADGVVRSVPLVIEDPEQRFAPALALEALRIVADQPDEIIVRPNGVQVGERFIPTDKHAGMRINYPAGLDAGGDHFLSALDVIQNDFDAGKVRGKTVFVGATDLGLGDYRLVPVNKGDGVPGVLVHVSALHTMLTRTYLGDASRTETLLWILLLAWVVALLTQLTRLWIASIVAFLVVGGWAVFVFFRFDSGRVYDLVYPLLAVVLAFVIGLGLRYLTEGRRRRRVTSLFSQYVPAAITDQLVDDAHLDDAIEGQRIEATILFCDLRGFTAMSEKLPAPDVRAVCEVYYEELTDIVYRHGGTLMSYLGDAVFAMFGAPIPDENHALSGLRAAIEMRDAAPKITAELASRGLPALAYGTGLNTGDVVAACVGGTHRRQYTALGDPVNISARLCGIAGADDVILADEVRQRIPDDLLPPLESVGPVTLKNVSRELVLWRVVFEGADGDGKSTAAAVGAGERSED